ncbi:DoxX family protein [Streptomyces sp. NBC_00322]|uniref:DoxX family protein n=1 Tax=Streptomyces sp. NBC_00322 TaxID=2975712 RepID=UPI002E28C4B6|nr:DoxX family protein [Streptomyces sp. NBC_00322]
MHVAYWIVAAPLALFYIYAGGKKLLQDQEQLRPMMGWVDSVPMPLVKLIGALEVLGALGLLLPPLTGITAWLAVAAAVGLVLVQIGGMTLHLSRGEVRETGLNIVLLVLAAVSVWLGTVWL